MGFMLALFLDTAKQLDPLIIASHLAFIPGLSFLVSPLVGDILHKLSADTDETTSYLNTIWRLAIFGVSAATMFSSVDTLAKDFHSVCSMTTWLLVLAAVLAIVAGLVGRKS